MDFGLPVVATIVVISYLAGDFVKKSKVNNKWIPEVCGCVGGILGVVALLIKMPGFPANDILTALAVGIVSGFGATGINQVKKQLDKSK